MSVSFGTSVACLCGPAFPEHDHTLGREVILITQNGEDTPFDLRHLRYVPYLNNGAGLAALSERLQSRPADAA
jgi:hypothetical protein